LKQWPLPGRWHLLSLIAGRGPGGVKLFVDGKAQRERNRVEQSTLHVDEITFGARRYSHTTERPYAQSFFQGEIAEVIVFDRVLSDHERAYVENYLDAKYGALLRGIAGAPVREGAAPLITAPDPPPIQFHFPGFTSRELPVELNNINNVRYRTDGKLIAVGYDGRVWLLSDTDGDGLEDKAE